VVFFGFVFVLRIGVSNNSSPHVYMNNLASVL
jgi:hypothetical protein